uniref:AB hydrolase-1 domain-containing protein n=1 Tax=Schistocephalus solidus TaxID=70667 RepID=A0A183SZE0_SCHSO
LPNTLERTCSFYISTAESCFGLAKWTVLFWFPFALRTAFEFPWLCLSLCIAARNMTSVIFYAKLFGCFSLAYLLAYVCLGISRLQNPAYARFVDLYFETRKRPSKELINRLTAYGFRYQWPAEFDVQTVSNSLWIPRQNLIPDRSNNTSILLSPIQDLVEPRMKAWDDLRVKHGGRRLGLITRSGRFVETYSVDHRGRGENSNEDILVICCEGNAGFAEIGIIGAPLQNGYSVLAWNHPGFGSSETLRHVYLTPPPSPPLPRLQGFPYPDQEQEAMEAVLLFATCQLNFQTKNIRLFGWSIGGYTATWAAAHMPQIGGLILDATFDMLDELARNALPFLGESITVGLVHSYFDLNIAAQIARGPESNRGNYLLVKLLKYRFPFLFTEESEQRLWQFVVMGAAQQEEFLATRNIVDDLMEPILQRELRKTVPTSEDKAETSFHSNLGSTGISEAQKIQILLYLTTEILVQRLDLLAPAYWLYVCRRTNRQIPSPPCHPGQVVRTDTVTPAEYSAICHKV